MDQALIALYASLDMLTRGYVFRAVMVSTRQHPRISVNQRPTQTDIARAAGVSRGLVSLALSGSAGVSQDTRARIAAIAGELGYVRNIGAAALAGRFHSALGFVLPDLRNPFYETLVSELQQGAGDLDLLPLIVTSLNRPEHEAQVVRKLQELDVAGIMVVSPVEPAEELVRVGRSLPMVVIGGGTIGGTVDTVHMDEIAAAQLIARHVHERGWQRVLHLSARHESGDIWVGNRRNAIASALTDIPLEDVVVDTDDALSPIIGEFHPEDRERPLAIVVHNDKIAIDVVPALHRLGLTPGHDVAIISYDDTHVAERPEWSLTSIHQDAHLLISTALEHVTRRQNDYAAPAENSVIQPTLTVRSTS